MGGRVGGSTSDTTHTTKTNAVVGIGGRGWVDVGVGHSSSDIQDTLQG